MVVGNSTKVMDVLTLFAMFIFITDLMGLKRIRT
jgi:hypothetical protein